MASPNRSVTELPHKRHSGATRVVYPALDQAPAKDAAMLFDDADLLSKKLEDPIGSGKIPDWLALPDPKGFRPKRKFRTVWISDVHLGTRGCNAALLVDFLRSVECETLYLVGDIVDGWRLRKGWYWPDAHNEVIRRVLKMAHRGTRVVFVAGNHDEMLRDYAGLTFGGVELVLEAIHTTADNRRLLVTHGDSFDGVVLYAKWLAFLGDKAYGLLLRSNIWVNAIRRRLRMPYWSLSSYMKKRVKNAVQYVCSYEEAVAREALERGLDGIVCGHIHCAEIRQIGPITYYNDGDWVESCTALTEDAQGHMALLDWAAETAAVAKAAAPAELEPA
jgi:UDP-2,3-diacylglucosamine pyrophosphatase LpxH